jgi:hypothetical protein
MPAAGLIFSGLALTQLKRTSLSLPNDFAANRTILSNAALIGDRYPYARAATWVEMPMVTTDAFRASKYLSVLATFVNEKQETIIVCNKSWRLVS